MTEKEKLYSNIIEAQKTLDAARTAYRKYEDEDRAKEEEKQKQEWHKKYIVPLLNCEGKYFKSCAGRQYIYIEKLTNLDKINIDYGCDFHSIGSTPEFTGIEIYYAEQAYEEWNIGRWDISLGGTIHIPFLNGIWEEITKEEFISHYYEYLDGLKKCQTYIRENII